MAEDSASASGQTAARRPIFREHDPDEGDELETTEIESLCMACGENVRRFKLCFLPTNMTGGIDSRVEGPSFLLSMLLLAHNCNGGLSDGVQEMLNWSSCQASLWRKAICILCLREVMLRTWVITEALHY